MRRSLTPLLLAGPLVLAACGSTVAPNGVPGALSAGAGGGGELGLTPADGPEGGLAPDGPLDVTGTGADGATAAPGVGPAAGGGPAVQGGAGADPGTAAPASGAGGPAAVGTARGVTATTLSIGVPVETGTQAAADAFGIEGTGTLSTEQLVDAVVTDVNRTGGVLGRKLQPVYHRYDTGEAISNPDRAAAKICADYGTDRPVFAVVIGIPMPGLRKCTAEMGSPLLLVGGSTSTLPRAAYDANGGRYLYGATSITNERLAELFIESLEERGFHSGWNTTTGGPGPQPTKLGVIHADTPDLNHLYASYAKELGKRGRRYDATVTYPANVQDGLAATQSAVLKFKSDGITHVYGASVFFLQAAEQQGYRPRYAYLPGLGALGVANSPPVQLRGAMTVGWLPARDVNAPQDPGRTPGADRCLKAMTAAGLSSGNRSDQGSMYAICDVVYSFREALTRGGVPSVAGLRQGFPALGNGFRPALAFASRLGPGRLAGVDSVRDMAFDSDCECLVYTSRADRR